MRKGAKRSSKRSHKRRGGSWFSDLGAKIKNEFTNPQSLLRQSDGVLDRAASALSIVPGVGQALSAAQRANQMAKQVGLGKYVVYRKRKSHGKRRSTKRK